MTIAGVAVLCFVAIFITPSFGDELNYHYPLAKNITIKTIVDPGSDYSSAYMPLPYLLGNVLLRLFDSLLALRILNFIVFLLAIFFFDRIALSMTKEHKQLTLLAFLNPYLLFSSFVYYMYSWGVLFALLGLYFYLMRRSKPVADIFLALAVLSQQWMVVVVAAIIIHEGTLVLERRLSLAQWGIGIARKTLFLLPAAAIFISWRGLTHPSFSSHGLHPSFEHLNIVLVNLGFMFVLVVLANFKSFLKTRYLPLIFLLPILYLSIPAFSSYNGINQINGFIANFADKVDKVVHIPFSWVLFPFIAAGLLLLVLLLKGRTFDDKDIFLFIVCGFIAAFVAHSRLASAHVYLSLPLVILFLQREILSQKWLPKAMFIQYLLIAAVYLIFTIFFRSHGIEL